MLRLIAVSLVVVLLMLLCSGCDPGFPDEEMHFGIEDKVRPYAVVCEPPDVAPGDTVSVTFMAQAPSPSAVDIIWQIALDYKIGQYGADEVERRYVSLPSPAIEADEDGFFSQTFPYVLPDSVHLWSSALPDIIEDPIIAEPARLLLGLDASDPVTKVAIDAWLRALTPQDVGDMDPLEQQLTWYLSDVFACQVRFRATLQTDITVDVTRNLTVRHTRRLGGPNANTNAAIDSFSIVEVHKEDADQHDLKDPTVTKTWYHFIENGLHLADRLEVPRRTDRTYYVLIDFLAEHYTSPYDYADELSEEGRYRWYYYREDQPGSDHQFFVDESGEETEMYTLDEYARLNPAGVGSIFRIVACVRDEREEWQRYYASPGATVETGTVVFVAP